MDPVTSHKRDFQSQLNCIIIIKIPHSVITLESYFTVNWAIPEITSFFCGFLICFGRNVKILIALLILQHEI